MAINVVLTKVITPIAVPLFFLISGGVLFRNYTNEVYRVKLIGRIRTLLIPYLCWNIFNMMFEIATSYTFVSKYFIGREKFVITPLNILLNVFFWTGNKQFWFIFCLIIFTMLAPVFDLFLKKKWTGIGTLLALIILYQFNISLPETVFFSGSSVIYFFAGALIGRYYKELAIRGYEKKKDTISIILTILLMAIMYLIPNTYKGVSVVLLILTSILFWNAMNIVMHIISVKKYMKRSFLVYALHVNLSAIITKVLYLIGPKSVFFSLVNFLLTTALTLGFIETFALVTEKHFPKIYSILTGDRC